METIETPSKDSQIKVRNEKGQILKGAVLNPMGKPLGTKHMSTLIMQALTKVAKDTGTSQDVEIVKQLLDKAHHGDLKAIEMVLDRTDGKPIQQVDQRVQQVETLTPEQITKLKALLNG